MKLYRVHYRTDGGNSAGFSWHGSYDEAKAFAARAIKDSPDEYESLDGIARPAEIIDTIMLPATTRAAILALLNDWADHPDKFDPKKEAAE
jgi:hypothetical protein